MGRTTTAALVATVAIGLALVLVISTQGFSAGLSTSSLGSGQFLDLNIGPTGALGDDGVEDALPVAATSGAGDDTASGGATQLTAVTPAPDSGPTVLPDGAGSSGPPGTGQVADPGPSSESPGPSGPGGPGESPEGPGTDEPGPPSEPGPGEQPTPTDPPTDPGTPVDNGNDGEDPGSTPVDDGDDGEDTGGPGPIVPIPDGDNGSDGEPIVDLPDPPANPGPPVVTPPSHSNAGGNGNGNAFGHSK
jgi:hypothetical protein